MPMPNKDFHLLEELDNISKMHFLDDADIDQVILDFSKGILPSLNIERLNIWLFDQDKTSLVSIGEYDSRSKKFKKNSVLEQVIFPVYFEGLKQNKLIIAEDIYTHPLTKEFNEVYSKPNDIHSLLDIPLRVSGKLVGVICFEKTGCKKYFSLNEQSFCFSISYVLSSILENRHRLVTQIKLENALKEKEMLMNELNHRVKNNFSILISLLRLSKNKVKTQEAQDLLSEYEQRIFSMLKIYDLLNNSKNFSGINVADYIKGLVNEFCVSYPQFNHCINLKVDDHHYELPSKTIVNIGLIVSEILLNSIKHAAQKTSDYNLLIELKEIEPNKIYIKIGDNGPGFDFEKESQKDSLGLQLISGLAESIDMEGTYPTTGNAYYRFALTF